MINKFIFDPFSGIGLAPFGTPREALRKSIGQDFRCFKRNEFSENTSDYYQDINLFVEYDRNDYCVAFELAAPNYLEYRKTNLFELSFLEIRKKFDIESEEFEIEDETGATYFDLGFGVFSNPDTNKVETIIIFSYNYW